MKLIRLIRLQMLVLFTLLQCVAPVAHAHVNGHNTDHGVHLAFIEHAGLSGHHSALPRLAVAEDNSSVVVMPPEYRSADLAIAQSAAVAEQLFALREHIAFSFVASGRQALPLLSYQHPRSQAPPV